MIGTEIIKAVLKTLFGFGDYVNMYEVIDDDMIRKPAISIKKLHQKVQFMVEHSAQQGGDE